MKKSVIRGKPHEDVLSGDRVIVEEQTRANQLYERSFGEMKRGKLYLNLYEALLLAEEGKIGIGESVLRKRGKELNEGFEMKYEVFRDLRATRGLVVKSGIKFGCDFVVYARGKKPGKSHSRWMLHVVPESARLDYAEITRAARLATNVKKRMLFASVTERGPVYYEVSRAKL